MPALKAVLRESGWDEDALGLVRRAFDTVGDVAIIRVHDDLLGRARELGEAVLAVNKKIKTVCRPVSGHDGEFRVQPLVVIAGEERNPVRAAVTELGCRLQVDLDRVFYCGRLMKDRERIAGMVQPDERIGCFFAGTGPFPVVLSRKAKAKPSRVVAVELNPHAVANMQANVAANKVGHLVEIVHGDAKVVAVEQLCGCFDRITMPIPHGATFDANGDPNATLQYATPREDSFLRECLPTLVDGGICHYYEVITGPRGVEQVVEMAQAELRAAMGSDTATVTLLRHAPIRQFLAFAVQHVFDLQVHYHAQGNE